MKIKLNELENRVNYADKNLPARLPKFTPPPPVAPKPTRYVTLQLLQFLLLSWFTCM